METEACRNETDSFLLSDPDLLLYSRRLDPDSSLDELGKSGVSLTLSPTVRNLYTPDWGNRVGGL